MATDNEGPNYRTLIVAFFFSNVLGGAVSYCSQVNLAAHQEDAALRATARAEAGTVMRDLSRSMKREQNVLYDLLRAMAAAAPDSTVQARKATLDRTELEWSEVGELTKAQLCQYFGPDVRDRYETYAERWNRLYFPLDSMVVMASDRRQVVADSVLRNDLLELRAIAGTITNVLAERIRRLEVVQRNSDENCDQVEPVRAFDSEGQRFQP